MKGNLYLIAIIGLLFFFFPTANALQTWDGTASEAWTNGSGTEANPYLIETPAHLAYLSAQVAAGNTYEGVYFLQTDDLDLNSKMWTPIGTDSYKFAGVYDGGEKYISNISVSRYGIFGITNNVAITNLYIKGTYAASSNISTSAPLIGEAQGTTKISNCHNMANITENSVCAGLIAIVSGELINVYRTSNQSNIISKVSLAGGLIARVQCTKIVLNDCFNNGVLTISNPLVGGYMYVSSGSVCAGGLVGEASEETAVTLLRCFNEGDINTSVTIRNSTGSSFPQITITSHTAGLIGKCSQSMKGLLQECYSIADFTAITDWNGASYYSYKNKYMAGLVNGNCDIIGSYVRTGTNLVSTYSSSSYIYVTVSAALLGGTISESCYAIGNGDISTEGSSVYHTSNTSTGGIYKSDVAFKVPSMISLLNTIDEFFTMDLEGINDGYPILKWQAGKRYNINATCDATRGTVKGGGEYAMGNTVTLTATPKKGCTFVGWSDGNTDNPRTITVEGDANYMAQFIKSAYTIYVNQDCTSYIE